MAPQSSLMSRTRLCLRWLRMLAKSCEAVGARLIHNDSQYAFSEDISHKSAVFDHPSRDGVPTYRVGRVRWRGPGSRAPSRDASRPLRLRSLAAILSRSPEALAFGARRHFIPASLSLPLRGCLLSRSTDCSRSRVPPRLARRRYADAPAAASFSWLLRYFTRG